MENIFSIFKKLKKEISKRCVIIEFSDQSLKLVEVKLINKKVSFRAFRNIKLPPEALNKGVPTDKEKMSKLISDLLNEENINLYNKYKKMSEKENNIHFIVRLASYKYFNMDQAIKNSLEYFLENPRLIIRHPLQNHP